MQVEVIVELAQSSRMTYYRKEVNAKHEVAFYEQLLYNNGLIFPSFFGLHYSD